VKQETLNQYTRDKYEHDRSCIDGYITLINKFTGRITEVRCPYCKTIEKAQAKRAAQQKAIMAMSDD